ncbi:MAG TPA: HNH endonuclease [Streptomyces sp.]|nr:HNH endonuclease [Streptomyces sp.]
MTRDIRTGDELLSALAGLRRASVGGQRAPHKPLLLLWLLGRFAATGGTAVSYAEAEEPVSRMINDYGPPARVSHDRAAMPFVHLERTLWDLRDADGRPLAHTVSRSGAWLRARGAAGRLLPSVERLLADHGTLVSAARLLLDLHFTPALDGVILADAGLDLPALQEAVQEESVRRSPRPGRRPRRADFAEEVLQAYAFACAMCGYDGALGRNPVGLEAAHVRWHSQGGPDELRNAVALCALHHALFDLGALGLTPGLRIRVSPRYTARSRVGRAVDALDGTALARPRPGRPAVDEVFVAWHDRAVFKQDRSVSA